MQLLSLVIFCVFAPAFSVRRFPQASGVINLDDESYDAFVGRSGLFAYVLFHNHQSRSSQTMGQDFIKAAKASKGLASFAAVNCALESAKETCSKTEYTPPEVFVFSNGEQTTYEGKVTQKGLTADITARLESVTVPEVTTKGHLKFFKSPPLSEVPRALFFTKAKTTPLIVRAMAREFEGRMVFGTIQKKEKKLFRKYQVGDVPTLLVIPANDEGAKAAHENTRQFTGIISAGAVQAFLKQYVDTEYNDQSVTEVVDQSCLLAHCTRKGGLCLILFPSDTNPKKVQYEIDQFGIIESQRKDTKFNFVHVNTQTQAQWANDNFGIVAQPYPQVVALSPRKNVFVRFVGTFNTETVPKFLNNVAAGKITTSSVLQGEVTELTTDTEECAALLEEPSDRFTEAPQEQDAPAKENRLILRRGGKRGKDHTLNPEEYTGLVLDGPACWIVRFVRALDKESELNQEWVKTAKSLNNQVNFATIDLDAAGNDVYQAQYDLGDSAYTVIAFAGGHSADKREQYVKLEPDVYSTYEELSTEALRLVGSLGFHVFRVSAQTLNSWIGLHPEMPKLILFTDKQDPPTLLSALGTEFWGYASVGLATNIQQEVMQQFGITEQPSLALLYGKIEGKEGDGTKVGLQVMPVPKPWHFNAVAKVLDQFRQKYNMPTPEDLRKGRFQVNRDEL